MKIESLFTYRTAGLAAAALLTVAFAGGCQSPDDRTIHVPPGGAKMVPAGTTVTVPDGGARYRLPAGATITITTDSTIDVPGGSTIHVPPGGSSANDVSKDSPRHKRQHHQPEPVMTATPPPGITHPGG